MFGACSDVWLAQGGSCGDAWWSNLVFSIWCSPHALEVDNTCDAAPRKS
jgi:hypothetical protein